MKKCFICALVIVLSISVLMAKDCGVSQCDGTDVNSAYYAPYQDTICYLESRITLILGDNANIPQLIATLTADSCEILDSINMFKLWQIETPVDTNIFTYMAILEDNANIDSTFPIEPGHMHSIPSQEWHMDNNSNDSDIDLERAWDITEGKKPKRRKSEKRPSVS